MPAAYDSSKYKAVNLKLPVIDRPLSMEVYPEGDLVSAVLMEEKIWESYETEIVIKRLSEGPAEKSKCFVDVGANIGYYSLIASEIGGGQVYAFEPESCNFHLLKRNVAGCDRVKLFNLALADYHGHERLCLSDNNAGDHRLGQAGERSCYQEIETITGDAVIEGPVGFIKIDTQGAEYKVLTGLADTLQNNRDYLDLIVEFWPEGLRLQGNSADQLIRMLVGLEMDIYIIDHQHHNLISASAEDLEHFSNIQAGHENGGGFMNLFLTTGSVANL